MRDCRSGQPDRTAVTVSAGRHKVPDGRDGAQNRTGAADFAAARQLARRFVRADVFAPAAAADGVVGEMQLNLLVTDFYHDASSSPGPARVDVSAELVDRASRKLIARSRFTAPSPR